MDNKITVQNTGRENIRAVERSAEARVSGARNNDNTRKHKPGPCTYDVVVSAEYSAEQDNAVAERAKLKNHAGGV